MQISYLSIPLLCPLNILSMNGHQKLSYYGRYGDSCFTMITIFTIGNEAKVCHSLMKDPKGTFISYYAKQAHGIKVLLALLPNLKNGTTVQKYERGFDENGAKIIRDASFPCLQPSWLSTRLLYNNLNSKTSSRIQQTTIPSHNGKRRYTESLI